MNYDTLKLARALETAGLDKGAADAIVEAVSRSQDSLVTKDELAMSETRLEKTILEAGTRQAEALQKQSEMLNRLTFAVIGLIFAGIGAVGVMVHFFAK